MKIYTRHGDRGETGLFGGARVAKDHLRVEAYGAVDELNASIGVAAVAISHPDLRDIIQTLQMSLFDLGAYLASPGEPRATENAPPRPADSEVAALEKQIDRLDEELEPLRCFVLPGGTAAAAALHVARTVCRTAERRCVALHREEPLRESALRYLNRLSDLLFVMARVENRRAGVADIEWQGRDR